MNEETTFTGRTKKPWYKRPEIVLPTFGPILCAIVYGIGTLLITHFNDAWNVGESNKRMERRIYRIEMALKINDPVPFTFQETNDYTVVDNLTTNFIDP